VPQSPLTTLAPSKAAPVRKSACRSKSIDPRPEDLVLPFSFWFSDRSSEESSGHSALCFQVIKTGETDAGNPSACTPSIILRPQRYRSPVDQAKASLDERSGRADEPHPKGRDGETLLLRNPRSTASPRPRVHRCLQLRSRAQDPQRPHILRAHLQSLDFTLANIQNQPAPAMRGTVHLER
jgi:hypothetical protein